MAGRQDNGQKNNKGDSMNLKEEIQVQEGWGGVAKTIATKEDERQALKKALDTAMILVNSINDFDIVAYNGESYLAKELKDKISASLSSRRGGIRHTLEI